MSHAALRALAEWAGILPEYVDQTGQETRETTDEERMALLEAMGFHVPTEASAARALEEVEARESGRILPASRVVVIGAPDADTIQVKLPDGFGEETDVEVEMTDEGGATATAAAVHIDAERCVLLTFDPPPALGYHQVRVRLTHEGQSREGRQTLIVTPPACPDPLSITGRRVFGITVNLYTLRSARNWGAGDTGDIATLIDWCVSIGAEFIGVNPLHALYDRGSDISPYSPVSRLFRNPLYIDVEALPEMAASESARALIASPPFTEEIERLRGGDTVEYERVMRLKRPVLEALHRTFCQDRTTERRRRYAEYAAREGDALRDFATFFALHEHFADRPSWREWPAPYRDPRSPQVAAFREKNAPAIDFHQWLQFALDEQLAGLAERARRAGMVIGMYQDLAIGTAGNSSDAWAFPDLFMDGVSIGAPPDPLAAGGQNWGLPPLDPRRISDDGYAYWVRLLRASMRHAGALRIDHVMGLFRQFWIPRGKSGEEGAYVRFPADDLLGILALEAQRHNAIVVGEDLGTVPPEVPPALAARNVLSSKVLYFERTGREYQPAASYQRNALATANTHDMATLAGFWRGRDIELRRGVSAAVSDDEVQHARAERQRERDALMDRLEEDESLPGGREPVNNAEVRGAVHSFLCSTPSVLVGLSLDDLVGEIDPVNVPGSTAEQYPSWTRRMRLPLEQLPSDPDVRTALGECPRTRGRGVRSDRG